VDSRLGNPLSRLRFESLTGRINPAGDAVNTDVAILDGLE
jgi:hypothetical protein